MNRLYTSTSGVLRTFFETPKNNRYYDVYLNNMDESSFIGPSKGLQKVMLNQRSAYVSVTEVILASDEYKHCKIELIPWQQRLGYNTIIIQKSSPFEQFMKQVILDIYSKGILSKLQQKWSIKETYCEEPDIKTISPQNLSADRRQ